MYRNIIKNNSYPLPSKSVTTAPKIGTSSPIPDTMMIYDHSNPLLTHHSNQLLTHSLTIPAKIESPLSLASLALGTNKKSKMKIYKSIISGKFQFLMIKA